MLNQWLTFAVLSTMTGNSMQNSVGCVDLKVKGGGTFYQAFYQIIKQILQVLIQQFSWIAKLNKQLPTRTHDNKLFI